MNNQYHGNACFVCRYAEKYEGSKARECQPGGRYFNQKAAIKESLREADKALKMTTEERKNLVVCIPSDDEEGEDEENMEVDGKNCLLAIVCRCKMQIHLYILYHL